MHTCTQMLSPPQWAGFGITKYPSALATVWRPIGLLEKVGLQYMIPLLYELHWPKSNLNISNGPP